MGLGTVLYSTSIGVIIGVLEKLFSNVDFLNSPFIYKLIAMLVGHIGMAFGIALVLAADIGINALDAILTQISNKTNIKYQYLKIAVDVILCLSGFLIGGTLGIGTIMKIIQYHIAKEYSKGLRKLQVF